MSASLPNLLRYVGFSATDEAALQALHAALEPGLDDVVEAFYLAIERDEEARAILRDDAQTARLKLSLYGWLERLLSGPWDADYARLRERIGHVHVWVGLPQRFMMTSMSVIRCKLHEAVEVGITDRAQALECHQALARILDVDLAMMLETYREDSIAVVRRLEEVERKLLTDELNLSEERYRAVLETAEVLAITVDTSDSVKLFNRQAELLSGRNRTEVLDLEGLNKIWHPSDFGRVCEAINATRGGRTSHVITARLVRPNGDMRFVRWHITSLPPDEICLIGIDLTSERRLAARTRRAEELATLGTLAAGLAHEIRNPLNAAQLQLTVAQRRLARAEVDSVVALPIQVVREELDRLATLVQDFLSYARPAPLKLRALDLSAAARSMVEFLAPVAQQSEVSLTIQSKEAVTASCDEEQCRQVMLNLIKNAIEAAALGGHHVEITTERRGPSAVLCISDDGPGFPDDIEDIFEPFATSKEGGTGLGLSIVKRIIEQHNGSVATLRIADKTIFEIEVPIAGPSD